MFLNGDMTKAARGSKTGLSRNVSAGKRGTGLAHARFTAFTAKTRAGAGISTILFHHAGTASVENILTNQENCAGKMPS